MDTNAPVKKATTKLTLDVNDRTLELLGQEAAQDRRSRKAHIELLLDKHAERYSRKIELAPIGTFGHEIEEEAKA